MQHLGIIPDGNRRWAKNNKLKSFFGHKKGLDAFKTAIKFCLKKGIKYLSIYTFSLENFNRPEEEKNYLFKLLIDESLKLLKELNEHGVRIRFIGDKSFFPKNAVSSINMMEEETKNNQKLNLNLLFCYTGQQEIISATKNIAQKVKDGLLDVSDISEQTLKSSLWLADVPEPELIIRTSKRARLSGFLTYLSAYSEFMFLDLFWPEITENHLESCLDDFSGVERNFGK
jgi:undecaprenyl diphosphate synthase